MKCSLISLLLISSTLQAMTIEVVKSSSTSIDDAGLNVQTCDINKYDL